MRKVGVPTGPIDTMDRANRFALQPRRGLGLLLQQTIDIGG
jgi:hypothetical protein